MIFGKEKLNLLYLVSLLKRKVMQGIKGLMGCSCHPFKDWNECDLYHKRKFNIGQIVEHRCHGKRGEIHEKKGGGYYIVKYGDLPRDLVLVHAANLEPITEVQLELFKRP